MQFYKRLHQSQADARTACCSLSLEETLENLASLFLRDTLAGISHIQAELSILIFQRYENIATGRCIFQGIAQKIEDNTSYLLLICNHLLRTNRISYIQMELDLLAFSSKLEIAYPHFQSFHQVEAIERQFHLSVLNLSEIEDAAHQLLESYRITLHHLQKFTTLSLDTTVLQQHFHRIGNQCQWGTKLMTDICKEHQAGMGEFQHLLVQSFQLSVLAFQFPIHSFQLSIGSRQFLIQFSLHHITAENHSCSDNTNQQEQTQAYQHHFLGIIVRKIPIHLFMQSLQIMCLSLSISGFHQRKLRIFLGNDRCTEIVFPLKRLMLQDLHRQGNYLITLGRIKIGSLEDAIAHQLQATTLGSHSINTRKFITMLQPHLLGSLVGAPCQTIVVSKDIIKILCLLQDALHCLNASFLLPVASFRSNHLDTRIGFDGIHETKMALHGRRRSIQSTDFNNASLTLKLLSYKGTHRLTDMIVVAADECSIFIGIGDTIIQNHRDSLLVGTLNRLGNRTQLIRRDDQQVHALIHELINLFVLQHIVIIRGSKLHDNRIIEILSHLQLIIELVAPDILGALGYTNDKLLWLLLACCQRKSQTYIYNKV